MSLPLGNDEEHTGHPAQHIHHIQPRPEFKYKMQPVYEAEQADIKPGQINLKILSKETEENSQDDLQTVGLP